MSTTNTTVPPVAPAPAHTASAYQVTLPRVIRSEWIKLHSVRSTVVTFAMTGIAVVAAGVLVSMLSNGVAIGADGDVVYDPAGNSLIGTMIAQVVLGVLGALVITSEYSTGLIRATLTAVPKRLPVLWSKVIVVAGATFVTMVASLSVAFLAGQALYGGVGPGASLSDPGVAGALLGAAVYPTMIAVMGVALGALLRHTGLAVGILFGMLFVVPMLAEALGGVWSNAVDYLPGEAGEAMMSLFKGPGEMSPLAGFGVMIGWVGTFLAGATIGLKRRDA